MLAIGGPSGDDVYARDMSKPIVVTVDKSLAADLKKTADDYRRKDAFEFRAFNATRAEFTRGAQTVAFERVKGQGENATDSWKRVSPSAADADKSKVEALLAGLADIRAVSFTDAAAKTGLDKPAMTVVVKFEDGKKEERVSFAAAATCALIPDQPGAEKSKRRSSTKRARRSTAREVMEAGRPSVGRLDRRRQSPDLKVGSTAFGRAALSLSRRCWLHVRSTPSRRLSQKHLPQSFSFSTTSTPGLPRRHSTRRRGGSACNRWQAARPCTPGTDRSS